MKRRRPTLTPYLIIGLIAAATIGGLVARPDGAGVQPSAEQVIVVGAAGLRWDDVDPDRTPQLWRLAQRGAIGSMSVRSAQSPTCAADGWLTLGAGNFAADRAGDRLHGGQTGPPARPCPPLDVAIDRDNGDSVHLPHQEALVRYNQWELPWGTVPGALAGSVECTLAVGPGAAVAAARSFGRVDAYHSALPSQSERASSLLADGCELVLVDVGEVTGTGAGRARDIQAVDQALAGILEARPVGSLLIVAGVADTEDNPHLHVAVADGPGFGSGWLTSATTGRTGYLQLVDIAPTALVAIDRPAPEVPLAGNSVSVRPGRPADLTEAVSNLVAADREAVRTRPVASWFLTALTAAQLVLFVAMVPLLRRPERLVGSRRLRAAVGVLLVAAGLAIPAALTAGAVPWWRAETAGRLFTLTSLLVLAAGALVVARAPAFRHALSLVGAASAVAAVAIAADLFTGSWLQLNSVVGYSAHDGGRYAGLGEIGLGVLIASVCLLAASVAEVVPRRRRPLVVAGVGSLGVVLIGSPYLGDNIGGAVAMIVGVCLAAALCTGGWLTARRVTWAVLTGFTVVVVAALFDLRRPVESRSGLGSMLTQIAEGTAGFGTQRVSQSNAEALTGTPLTILAIGSGVFLWFALLRHWGGLRRLFGIHPALRAGVAGAAVASVLGGIFVGAALTVAGAAAAVGVPLLTLVALRHRQYSVRVERPVPVAAVPAARE